VSQSSVHNSHSTKVKADIGAGVAILVWGLTALLYVLLGRLGALQLLAMPLLVGGVISLSIERRLPRLFVRCRRHWLAVGLLGGNLLCYVLAFRLAPPAQVDLIYYLWPLMVVVSQAMSRGHQLGPMHWVGLFIGFMGPLLLVCNQVSEDGFSLRYLGGYLLGFASAAGWASYSLVTRERMKSSLGDHQISAGLIALVFSLLLGNWQVPTVSEMGLVLLLGGAVYGIGCPLWVAGLRKGHYAVLGSAANAIPILSILFLIAGGEIAASGLILVSALLVVAGSLVVGLRPPRRPVVALRKRQLKSA